jgi:hypothetical protein
MVDAAARQWMADLEARTAQPACFMRMKRLQGIVVRELRDLLAEMNLGGGAKAAFVHGGL